MHMFIAKNDKQLGLCLKLLYSEQIGSRVKLELTERGKIVYKIIVDVDEDVWKQLEATYKILIG